MSENITNNTTNTAVLTEKEIFEQIVRLQNQLSEMSLHRLGEALSDARGEGEDALLSDDQVAEICTVFLTREATIEKMLSTYRQMYDDVRKGKNRIYSDPESEFAIEQRKQFLDFVRDTTMNSQNDVPGALPATLPDFEKIWKTVYLGE